MSKRKFILSEAETRFLSQLSFSCRYKYICAYVRTDIFVSTYIHVYICMYVDTNIYKKQIYIKKSYLTSVEKFHFQIL